MVAGRVRVSKDGSRLIRKRSGAVLTVRGRMVEEFIEEEPAAKLTSARLPAQSRPPARAHNSAWVSGILRGGARTEHHVLPGTLRQAIADFWPMTSNCSGLSC